MGTQGTTRGAPFTMISPSLFHRLSLFLDPEQIKSNKQRKNIINTANVALGSPLVLTLGTPLEFLSTNGAPRVYPGEYTWQQTVPLTQLNLSMQARYLERMIDGLHIFSCTIFLPAYVPAKIITSCAAPISCLIEIIRKVHAEQLVFCYLSLAAWLILLVLFWMATCRDRNYIGQVDSIHWIVSPSLGADSSVLICHTQSFVCVILLTFCNSGQT